MKCIVCGKEFAGGDCPRCRFPELHFPGDPKAGLASMRPQIEAHRQEFLRSVRVSLVAFRHEDADGYLRVAGESELPFGSGNVLSGKTEWLAERFAQTGDGSTDITLRIDLAGDKRDERVRMKKPSESGLLSVGIAMDGEYWLCVLLRSENGNETRSETLPLFA